jgi:integrase
MSTSVYRRCGCRDANGKQYGADCPQLADDPKHGSWAYYMSAGTEADPQRPGKRRRRQFREFGFPSKRAAQSKLAELRASLDRGTYTPPSKLTLAAYAAQWLPRRQATGIGLKASTAAGYRRYIETDIVPSRLGEMLLTEVRRSHIGSFAADLTAAGRGAVTVRRILAVLTTIMTSAVRDELIAANPALGADKPALPDDTVRVWEIEDVQHFLQRCQHHRLGPLFEIAILTGLRRGELTGLRWSDVDLAAGKVTIRRTRVSVRGQVLEQTTTKTRAGMRTVPLSDMAIGALLSWQLRQTEEREAAQEAWQTNGHVFTMPDGRALDPSLVTRTFQTIRRGESPGDELPPLSFHGLRHSFASLALAAGGDIAVISKVLGHSSIAITADTYSHLVGSIAQKAVDGAANLIAHTLLTQDDVSA